MPNNEKIPFLDLVTPHQELEAELTGVFRKALRTAGFIGGPMLEEFEHEFAEFCETKHCVGLGSGTDAVRFALIAAGVQPGTLSLPCRTPLSPPRRPSRRPGRGPDFVDIDEQTYSMDPEKLRGIFRQRVLHGTRDRDGHTTASCRRR